MGFAGIGKARVEDDKILSGFRIIISAVVTWASESGNKAVGIGINQLKLITAHELYAVTYIISIIKEGACSSAALDHLLTQRVLIGAIRVFGTANADVVAVVGVQAAKGEEEIIILCFGTVENIGRFDS